RCRSRRSEGGAPGLRARVRARRLRAPGGLWLGSWSTVQGSDADDRVGEDGEVEKRQVEERDEEQRPRGALVLSPGETGRGQGVHEAEEERSGRVHDPGLAA